MTQTSKAVTSDSATHAASGSTAATPSRRTKALSYLRVSGRGQVDGGGFDRQRDSIAQFARTAGYTVVEEFREEGISGTADLDDRPALAALLDRLESNGVRVVIVERADRLARDLMVGEIILDQLSRVGATVLTADGVDLTKRSDDDPTRTLIRQILGSVAEFDKRVTVLKLRAARLRRRKRVGFAEGRTPYGWLNDAERVVLLRMRELRRKPVKRDRRSYAEIAATLNYAGTMNRSGRPWSAQRVYAVLRQADVIEARRRTSPAARAPEAAPLETRSSEV